MAIKNVGWVIKIAHAQSCSGIVLFQFFMEHCIGAHKPQENLAEIFGSFDHPELSSTEQGWANVCKYWELLGEMLYSFDRGLSV